MTSHGKGIINSSNIDKKKQKTEDINSDGYETKLNEN